MYEKLRSSDEATVSTSPNSLASFSALRAHTPVLTYPAFFSSRLNGTMQNCMLAPPPRNRTLYPCGIPSSSRNRATASSSTASKSLLRCDISSTDRPIPFKSSTACAALSIAGRGRIDGPAEKLCFFMIVR